MIMLLSMVFLSFCAQATNSSENAATKPTGNFALLKQDSGLNISEMNTALVTSPTYSMAQAVKFTAPYAGWKIQHLIIAATDGWNANSTKLPEPLPFAIEIRNANLSILYHYSDTQLPYFTKPSGPGMAMIDIPDVPVKDDFYVCFYGYRSLGLASELQNATGNSYYYDRTTGIRYKGVLPLKNNQTIPVNWIIWVAGR